MLKRFFEPVFYVDVILATGLWSDIKIKGYKFLKENGNHLAGSVTFIDREEKKGQMTRQYLIHIEDPKNFYTLLHETHHLVNHILTDRQVPLEKDNDEVFAYYQTFWFKKLWRELNKKKK